VRQFSQRNFKGDPTKNQNMERNQNKTSEHMNMLRNLRPSEDAKNYGMNQQEIQVMELHTRTG
jgi:hypothetical protein